MKWLKEFIGINERNRNIAWKASFGEATRLEKEVEDLFALLSNQYGKLNTHEHLKGSEEQYKKLKSLIESFIYHVKVIDSNFRPDEIAFWISRYDRRMRSQLERTILDITNLRLNAAKFVYKYNNAKKHV